MLCGVTTLPALPHRRPHSQPPASKAGAASGCPLTPFPDVCSSRFQANQRHCLWLPPASARPGYRRRWDISAWLSPILLPLCTFSGCSAPPRGPLSPGLWGPACPETPLFPSGFPPGGFILPRMGKESESTGLGAVCPVPRAAGPALGRTGGAACRLTPTGTDTLGLRTVP